jgi:hypothetical protein
MFAGAATVRSQRRHSHIHHFSKSSLHKKNDSSLKNSVNKSINPTSNEENKNTDDIQKTTKVKFGINEVIEKNLKYLITNNQKSQYNPVPSGDKNLGVVMQDKQLSEYEAPQKDEEVAIK